MASNIVADDDGDSYWNQTVNKGFSFEDLNLSDSEWTELDSSIFGTGGEKTSKISQNLQAEIISLQSCSSEGSFEEDADQSRKRLNQLQDLSFLWMNGNEAVDSNSTMLGINSIQVSGTGSKRTEKRYYSWSQSIQDCIEGLLTGAEVELTSFKSLELKKTLLKKAIELNDGNAITEVTLFLQRTLRPHIFRNILLTNPVAVDHYIHYLETRNELNHLIDLLTMLGRTKHALILRYKQIVRRNRDIPNLIKDLEHFYNSECLLSQDDVIPMFRQHIDLLGTHKAMMGEKSFNPVKVDSILSTLEYAGQYHYEAADCVIFSPKSMKSMFNLTNKQYSWPLFRALHKQNKWPCIERLLIEKSWLGTSKETCILPVESVCMELANAPNDLISRFLNLITDSKQKLALAKKLKCHTTVIDIYAQQKDREFLLAYKSNFDENSKEYAYIEKILKSQKVKWKN